MKSPVNVMKEIKVDQGLEKKQAGAEIEEQRGMSGKVSVVLSGHPFLA